MFLFIFFYFFLQKDPSNKAQLLKIYKEALKFNN